MATATQDAGRNGGWFGTDRAGVHQLLTAMKKRKSALGTYFALWVYVSEDGLAWPSDKTLAADTHQSKRDVALDLQELVKQGYLEVAEAGSGRRATRYRVPNPELCGTTCGTTTDSVVVPNPAVVVPNPAVVVPMKTRAHGNRDGRVRGRTEQQEQQEQEVVASPPKVEPESPVEQRPASPAATTEVSPSQQPKQQRRQEGKSPNGNGQKTADRDPDFDERFQILSRLKFKDDEPIGEPNLSRLANMAIPLDEIPGFAKLKRKKKAGAFIIDVKRLIPDPEVVEQEAYERRRDAALKNMSANAQLVRNFHVATDKPAHHESVLAWMQAACPGFDPITFYAGYSEWQASKEAFLKAESERGKTVQAKREVG